MKNGYMKEREAAEVKEGGKMRSMQDIFNGYPIKDAPTNFLHMFYVKTDCGVDASWCSWAEEGTKYPKVNFIFAVK